MKINGKRWLGALLGLVLCLALLPTAARAESVTITFDANGGTCATTSESIAAGGTLPSIPTATRAGFNFLGWYDANDNQITAATGFATDTTVTAEWELATVEFTVTAPAAGKKVSDCYDITIASPALTKGTDWKFASGVNRWYEKGISTALDSTYVFEEGKTYKLETAYVAPVGWSWASNPSATISGKAATAQTLNSDGRCKFEFEFTVTPTVKYTVAFNSNGGTGSMSGVTVNESTYTLPANGFTAPSVSKYFAGWALSADGEPILQSSITLTGDVTLYAIWKNYEKVVDSDVIIYDNSNDIYNTVYKVGDTVINDPGKAYYLDGNYMPCSEADAVYTVSRIGLEGYTLKTKGTDVFTGSTETFVSEEKVPVFSAGDTAQSYTVTKTVKHYEVFKFYNTYDTYERNAQVRVTKIIRYNAVSGGNGTWKKGSGKDYEIVIKRSENDELCFERFDHVEIDGTYLEPGTDYDAKAGSTVITLKTTALEKLSEGTHTINVYFFDGQSTTNLTIKAATQDATPDTGDGEHAGLWAATMLAAFTCIGCVTFGGKKRKD